MPIADPLVMPIARELLDCFAQEISKVANPPANVMLRPGVSVDALISTVQNECCDGLAWVRPDGFYPTSAFPTQDETPLPKGTASWAVVLELGAVRCSPTPDENSIPTAAEWDAVVQGVMDDAAAMRRAVCCFIENRQEAQIGRNWNIRVLPGIWAPLATEGGCAGGVLPVTIQGPACDCADAGPES